MFPEGEPPAEDDPLNNSLMNESMIEDVILDNPDLEGPNAADPANNSESASTVPQRGSRGTLSRSTSVNGIMISSYVGVPSLTSAALQYF